MKSNQQLYAEVAYKAISREKQEDKTLEGKGYGQLCHRFPSLVLSNGLRLAVAFFEAKGKKDPKHPCTRYLNDLKLALDIKDWNSVLNTPTSTNRDYLYASRQVLSASVWFKRYAEGILKVEQAESDELEVGKS
ncbi:type III-B CRISPR module-associated protein Cmr5 [Saccharibacillus sacchari]|uniref:Type III-B CRISPR module-associated protein Cmr5 n=1 Tax=Saccharibacillus sacchari TaxID=456493 RepID=A0ACC6PBY1_9BACL